jgi:predicted aspartyl protease
MRDRYRWLSVLLSLPLGGHALAIGSPGPGPQQASIGFDLYWGYLMVARGSAGPFKGLNFLLDTGASPTVLDPRLAQRLHLQEFPASLAVLGGSVQAKSAIVPSLSFGPVQMDNISVLIEDLSFLQKALPVRLDGVIGLDVLGQNAFVIDYVVRQIHFGPLPALLNPIPFRVRDGLAIVDAAVNGVPARLLLDTGTSSLILYARNSAASVADVKITAPPRVPDKIGEFQRKQVTLHSLKLGSAEFKQEPAYVVPDGNHSGEAFDGLIGPAALGITRLAIDLGRGELAFSR